MDVTVFTNATLVLPHGLEPDGVLKVEAGRIAPTAGAYRRDDTNIVDLGGMFLAPGYVELHVHGGDGADFMDGTAEAFRTVCRAHARHGTTSLLPTTTVARHDQHLTFLGLCRRFKQEGTPGARVLGAHFYGPYFGPEAKGAHPGAHLRSPVPAEYEQYLEFADSIVTATVAPELPGAEGFVRACRARGIVCNVGHS